MSGVLPPAAILPTVLGTRIVLGQSDEVDTLAAQGQGAPDILGFLLPFTGWAILGYILLVGGLILGGVLMNRRRRNQVAAAA